MEPEALNHLDVLFEELNKTKPDEKIIKKAMVRLGISYSNDPVDRISKILSVLHPVSNKENPS